MFHKDNEHYILFPRLFKWYNEKGMKSLFISEVLKKVGETVELFGWVDTKRDHKKVVFIDLRDRSGIVQAVGDESLKVLSPEDVVKITGLVKKRPEKLVNPKIPTGSVELEIQSFEILNKSKSLPFPINTDGYNIEEEMRLKYRYVDLRRNRLQKNIMLRARFLELVRKYLIQKQFIEIETPLLTGPTPEGSRSFVIPSRLHHGSFYALPQSPQQYKQLLMVGGFERYFQLARCIRDEDLRADRGFEHTQIDIEMSFVEQKDVMALDEWLIISVIEELGYKIKQKPFPVYTYAQAMKEFGKDKFDLRSENDKKNGILAFAWVVDFPFFEKTPEGKWTFTHNPFSASLPKFKEDLLKKRNIENIITAQYDIVCNGYEVGGGSIRNHEPELLKKVFEIMGYSDERIQKEFGHMLEAFTLGAPPHGGLAHGVERMLMTITGEPYLREVVAFPTTSGGQTSVINAPSPIPDADLIELGIVSAKKKKTVRELVINKLIVSGAHTFQIHTHAPTITSKDSATVRNTTEEQGAKAIVMMGDNKPFMFVLSGNLKIDTKIAKKIAQVSDLRMATESELMETTGLEKGAVPPFGSLLSIPIFIDETLTKLPEITFNAGERTVSITMKTHEYMQIEHPILERFSKQ